MVDPELSLECNYTLSITSVQSLLLPKCSSPVFFNLWDRSNLQELKRLKTITLKHHQVTKKVFCI